MPLSLLLCLPTLTVTRKLTQGLTPGAGFSSWDWGQETVLPQSKWCLGLGIITKWKRECFDQPHSNGMEWKATFRTPVFVSNRCYRNNKVVSSVGGDTHGCGGDAAARAIKIWSGEVDMW